MPKIPIKKLQAFAGQKKPFPPKKGTDPGSDDEHDDEQESDEEKGESADKELRDAAKKHAAVVGKMAEDGKLDPEDLKWAKDYDPEEDGNPPQAIANEDIWERAKEAVDPEGKGAKYDEPYAVVMSVYKKMGGKLKGGDND